VLNADIAKLKQYRAAREFDEYKSEILSALERGELTQDDPRYVEFMRRQVELQSYGLGGDGLRRYQPGHGAWETEK